jgi:hypothetical protein
MQIYIKNRSIERKAKIANYLMYAGPILLVGIFILSFSYPESTTILGIAALISFVVSQYGIILKNRWGKRPRIDEIIDQSLKGLDSKFTIFHYELGANHVLISPSGIFALVPVILDGKIIFEDGKWWQIKKSLGRERKKQQNKITTDAEFEVRALSRSLQKKLPDQTIPEIKPILMFLHPDAALTVDHAPVYASHIKKLKSLIRKLEKASTLEENQIAVLADATGF